jgi:hypothetical protein
LGGKVVEFDMGKWKEDRWMAERRLGFMAGNLGRCGCEKARRRGSFCFLAMWRFGNGWMDGFEVTLAKFWMRGVVWSWD